MKITEDFAENIRELAHSPLYDTVITLLDKLSRELELELLRSPLQALSDEKAFLYAKCRADGAKKLYANFIDAVRQISSQP